MSRHSKLWKLAALRALGGALILGRVCRSHVESGGEGGTLTEYLPNRPGSVFGVHAN